MRYRVVVRGELHDQPLLRMMLDHRVADGRTTATIDIEDHAALYGLIEAFERVGAELTTVELVDDEAEAPQAVQENSHGASHDPDP